MSLCKVFIPELRITKPTPLRTKSIRSWLNGIEGETINEMFKTNFGKTNKFVMVKLGDTMVFPNEGEWYGHYEDGTNNYKTILRMNETNWYKSDLFGLKATDKAARYTLKLLRNHLQFTEKDLFGWIDKYFA